MQDEHRLALMLARLVDLLCRSPDASDDHKAALNSVGEITGRRSWSLAMKGLQISVEGVQIPPEVPLVPILVGRMRLHNVAEIHIGFGASGLDVMQLAKALSDDPEQDEPGAEVPERLRKARVQRIWVLSAKDARVASKVRNMRVTDQLEASGFVKPKEPVAESRDDRLSLIATGEAPDARGRLSPRMPVGSQKLGDAMKALAGMEAGTALSQGLSELTDAVVGASRSGKTEDVAEALAIGIRQEAAATDEETRRTYGVALRRMLGLEVLRPLAGLLRDPLYASDVMMVMERAGTTGTQLLLDLLVAAPTFAERKDFLSALRKMGEGTDNVISMLGHHQWYVVRNVADLIGELRMEEAVPALGEIAEHSDARVRRSVGIALARIGSRTAVRFLRSFLFDSDHNVRLAVAKELRGPGVGALAMTLINAADEEARAGLKAEYYRALGRIGTPDAVNALAQVAQPRGGLFGQRNIPARKAAVEALVLAGSDGAVEILKSLTEDKDREVRELAKRGIKEIKANKPD
jgi:HEAT repeat protein